MRHCIRVSQAALLDASRTGPRVCLQEKVRLGAVCIRRAFLLDWFLYSGYLIVAGGEEGSLAVVSESVDLHGIELELWQSLPSRTVVEKH